jgi:hypothetical protein
MIPGRRPVSSSWTLGTPLIVMLLLTPPLVGCGGGDAPSKQPAAPAPQGTLAGGGVPIEDSGAPDEASGAPQDPAGQDAPSPDGPAPEIP